MNIPFTLSGKVEHGISLGNKYDMPTANITPGEDISALTLGVYCSVIAVGEKEYPSITNLGVRPTVNNDGRVNAETFIYDFAGNLYGLDVKVTLLEFIRPEKRFDSVDDLYLQIKEDLQKGAGYHRLASFSIASA